MPDYSMFTWFVPFTYFVVLDYFLLNISPRKAVSSPAVMCSRDRKGLFMCWMRKGRTKDFISGTFRFPRCLPIGNNRDKVNDLEVICLPSHLHLMRNIDREAAKNWEKRQLSHFDVSERRTVSVD